MGRISRNTVKKDRNLMEKMNSISNSKNMKWINEVNKLVKISIKHWIVFLNKHLKNKKNKKDGENIY